MKLLDGKVALVSGASRGIGRAIVEVFLEHGAFTVITATQDKIIETEAELRAIFPGRVSGLRLDLRDKEQAEQAVEAAVNAFGRLDILVNNAGVHIPCPFLDCSDADFEHVFRVNVFGTFLLSQAAARQMVQAGRGGSILFISSASAKKPDRQGSAYNASKSAQVGLMRVMALELGQYQIRVNAILPGATDTEMLHGLFAEEPGLKELLAARTPLGRLASPRDQANAALFLCSDLATHITGEQLVVSGGEFMET